MKRNSNEAKIGLPEESPLHVAEAQLVETVMQRTWMPEGSGNLPENAAPVSGRRQIVCEEPVSCIYMSGKEEKWEK